MLETKTLSCRGALSQYICHQDSEFNDDITVSENDEDEEEKQNQLRNALDNVKLDLTLY